MADASYFFRLVFFFLRHYDILLLDILLLFLKLLDIITLFTLVLLRHLGGVIYVDCSHYSILPFVPLSQKRGVNF
jgi:hypothetical protein